MFTHTCMHLDTGLSNGLQRKAESAPNPNYSPHFYGCVHPIHQRQGSAPLGRPANRLSYEPDGWHVIHMAYLKNIEILFAMQ